MGRSLLALVFALQGCTLLLDPERPQCASADDCPLPLQFECTAEGSCLQVFGDWSCVSASAVSPEGPQPFVFRVLNAGNDRPAAAVRASLCPRASPTCTGVAMFTDDAGLLRLTSDPSEPQVVRLEAPGFEPTLVPLLAEMAEPYEVLVDLFPEDLSTFLERSVGVAAEDVERDSTVAVRVKDCAGAFGGGVTIDIPDRPEGSIPFYSDGGTLHTDVDETFAEGVAAVAGMPEGVFRVRVTVARTGELVGEVLTPVIPDADIAVYFAPRFR